MVGDGDKAFSRKNGVVSVARGAGVDYIETFSVASQSGRKGLYLGRCFHSLFKLLIMYICKVVPKARWNFGVLRAGRGRHNTRVSRIAQGEVEMEVHTIGDLQDLLLHDCTPHMQQATILRGRANGKRH